MDIESFVSETLEQIVKGVIKAQNATSSEGAKINPKTVEYQGEDVNVSWTEFIKPIEFDLAITVSSGSSGEKGGALSIAAISLGGKSSSEETNKSVSRVKFSIPIMLPLAE